MTHQSIFVVFLVDILLNASQFKIPTMELDFRLGSVVRCGLPCWGSRNTLCHLGIYRSTGEWMTVKDDHLYIGGLGKEWTTCKSRAALELL